MATIKDVAESAQVSTATVSRVLNRDDNIIVTPDVRLRIFRAAQVLGYVSPRQRRAAEHKKKLTIGVADWWIIRPDRPSVRLGSLESLVHMMTEQYEITFTRLSFGCAREVDGIIAFGVFNQEEAAFLRSLSHAIIFINSDQRSYEYDQVQVDYGRGMELLIEYLLDKKRYMSIGYIGGQYDEGGIHIGRRRVAWLRKVLETRGKYEPSTFHIGEISRESGYEMAKRAAKEGTLAEVMLLGSDEVAEGAMDAFDELGMRIPKDVAVIFYQDIRTLESKWPTGTCLEMYPDYVWENALGLLLGRLSQNRTQAVTVTVPTLLKIGDTA